MPRMAETEARRVRLHFFFFSHTFSFQLLDKPWSQVSCPSPPPYLPSIFIAHRVQQSHCSSISHRLLLTHALALSASQLVQKKKSQRIYTSMHSAGLELTKMTYTRLEDNLIRHRGDRLSYADALAKTASESIEAIVRRRRILFADFVARMGEERLPQRVMFGELVGGKGYSGGQEKDWMARLKICRYLESNSKGGERLLRRPADGFDE